MNITYAYEPRAPIRRLLSAEYLGQRSEWTYARRRRMLHRVMDPRNLGGEVADELGRAFWWAFQKETCPDEEVPEEIRAARDRFLETHRAPTLDRALFYRSHYAGGAPLLLGSLSEKTRKRVVLSAAVWVARSIAAGRRFNSNYEDEHKTLIDAAMCAFDREFPKGHPKVAMLIEQARG